MKKNNAFFVFPFVLCLIGVIWLCIAGIVLFSEISKPEKEKVEVDAVITYIYKAGGTYTRYGNHDKYTYAFVTFDYDGETYGPVILNYYNSSMHQGDTIKVKIDPKDPTATIENDSSIFILSIVFGVIGFVLLTAGNIILTIMVKSRKTREKILREGKSIMATITSIRRNRNVRVNGQCPSKIYCTYEENGGGTKIEFVSGNVFFDSSDSYCVGDPIEVRYLGNFDKYCVVLDK